MSVIVATIVAAILALVAPKAATASTDAPQGPAYSAIG